MTATDDELDAAHEVSPRAGRPSFDDLYTDAYGAMVRLATFLVDTAEEAEHVVQDLSLIHI